MLQKLIDAQSKICLVPGWHPPDPPKGWFLLMCVEDGAKYQNHRSRVTAIISAAIEEDGRPWVHLSLAHERRLPSYQELKQAHRAFIGDRPAVQLFMPKAQHVNIHSNALHLWSCLDEWLLPDFTRGTGSI